MLKIRSDIHPEDKQISILVNLAKRVIEVAGVMPKKKEVHPSGLYNYIDWQALGWNDCLEACTLAIAGGWVKREDLLTEEEIAKILFSSSGFLDKYKDWNNLAEGRKDIFMGDAKAILQAQEEKINVNKS
jgi:hypothetical protein